VDIIGPLDLPPEVSALAAGADAWFFLVVSEDAVPEDAVSEEGAD
jgi:hypothetical protein